MKQTGNKAHIFLGDFNPNAIIEGGTGKETNPDTTYFVFEKGNGSNIPVDVFDFFWSPKEGGQIALVAGDKVFAISKERYCKTSADYSFEQGTIDVGDDCDPGAQILDGIVAVSGSFSGFFQYNDLTGEFNNTTDLILNKFLKIVKDEADGTYEITERDDNQIFLLINMNSDAKNGQYEPWLMVPARISSVSGSLENTDAQNQSISWIKGEGTPVIYKRKKV
ncbi:MAG: hypothetical protein FWC36_06390 [Spirochaetes bacterium]|nr:hypothetical protein [Spirochaetota bacterium]